MDKYRAELGITSSGTPMAWSKGFVKLKPSAVNKTLRIAVRARELWMARRICSVRPPPKYWDITTPAPAARPVKKPTSIFTIGVDAPTAASALVFT